MEATQVLGKSKVNSYLVGISKNSPLNAAWRLL